MTSMLAVSDWPQAAVAIAGTLLVGSVVLVAVWQGLATLRARTAGAKEYRELAERLEQTQAELRELRGNDLGRRG
jgi:hypothetical protein